MFCLIATQNAGLRTFTNLPFLFCSLGGFAFTNENYSRIFFSSLKKIRTVNKCSYLFLKTVVCYGNNKPLIKS